MSLEFADLDTYLAECRRLTIDEIRAIVPAGNRCQSVLYDLMLEYPLREAKALRPALCIATCRALGGPLESVLRSAAIVELYHNAFLIHDDVEDASESRRGRPTLHTSHGVPVAVNVGDAMLALALQPLLDNMRWLGMGKALRILQIIARMSRESAEGQAIELDWIRRNAWELSDTDYVRMVYKKTSWYTFITPMLIGGVVTGATAQHLNTLRKFAALLGIAFQIQDDVLNLVGEGDLYGKEIAGDLWEGKRTLIVLHALRSSSATDQRRAKAVLSKRRPATQATAAISERLLASLEARGDITARGRAAIDRALQRDRQQEKTQQDVDYLLGLIRRHQSVDYARAAGQRYAAKAQKLLAEAVWMGPSVHRDVLQSLVEFVVHRER